jgi:cell division protein FtsW
MAKRVSVDKTLFIVTLLLVFIGLVMVFSASAVMAKERFGSAYTFLFRQMAWAVAGLIAMIIAMNVDYRRYKHPSGRCPSSPRSWLNLRSSCSLRISWRTALRRWTTGVRRYYPPESRWSSAPD